MEGYSKKHQKNIEWPSIPEPEIEVVGKQPVIHFNKGDLEHRISRMKLCLVGRIVGSAISVNAIRSWGKKVWRIDGELQVQQLPKGLLLFCFPFEVEARRVLHEGVRRWEGGGILLDVWHQMAGCYKVTDELQENGIWVHGLPVHLWSKSTFDRIRERCGGLLEVVNAR